MKEHTEMSLFLGAALLVMIIFILLALYSAANDPGFTVMVSFPDGRETTITGVRRLEEGWGTQAILHMVDRSRVFIADYETLRKVP